MVDFVQDSIACKELIMGGTASVNNLHIVDKFGSVIFRLRSTSGNSAAIYIFDNGGTQLFQLNANNDGGLCIGSGTLNTNSIAQFDSITKGVVMPRMSTVQASTLSGAICTVGLGSISGAIVWDSSLGKLKVFNGKAFETITSTASA